MWTCKFMVGIPLNNKTVSKLCHQGKNIIKICERYNSVHKFELTYNRVKAKCQCKCI